MAASVAALSMDQWTSQPAAAEGSETIENWSGTHKVTTKSYLQPESTEQVEGMVADAHKKGQKLRVVGNALSPNGIGLSEERMLSLALCDKVLSVDAAKNTVRVQAGCRVQQVVDALRPHGLTLQNFASISEQQIGGFLQVGAHGTGAEIPPVDEQVIGMRLVTPGLGTLELSDESHPELFRMAKVGLGLLGVVTEVTIQCVPRHKLVEKTLVLTREQVRQRHHKLLRENQHVRYMWIPYTNDVVVVACNSLGTHEPPKRRGTQPPKGVVTCEAGDTSSRGVTAQDKLQPLRDLLASRGNGGHSEEAVAHMNFAEMRDRLLEIDPLNHEWVAQVNRAEAQFWRRSQGTRVDFSDRVLGFECGGQQWVNEVAFPVGSLEEPDDRDLAFMDELLSLIQDNKLPAPAPIEQRWTARSTALMSPAGHLDRRALFSWVGIIHYLPTEDPRQRSAITKSFFGYRDLCRTKLWDRFGCYEHWAKIESPTSAAELRATQDRLRKRYPIGDFNAVRGLLDPKNILANDHVDRLFGTGRYSSPGKA